MEDDTQARRMRAEQRRVLRALLDEGEKRVPSTTTQILSALRREQTSSQQPSGDRNNHHQEILPVVSIRQQPVYKIKPSQPRRSRRAMQTLLSLVAVAAIVLASIGLFGYFIRSRPSATTPMQGTTPTLIPSASWSSVVITYRLNARQILANYDPVSGKNVLLASSGYADSTVTDGVSHDGHKLLYHIYDGTKTNYYIYPQTNDILYTTPGRGGPAIWDMHDHYVFISTSQGVAQVDTSTRISILILPALASKTLLFSNRNYLYFVRSYTTRPYENAGMLYRTSIANGNTQQVTPCQHGRSFWLSPSGSTIYYECLNRNVLYAVNSDGNYPHAFRNNAGTMVGYAADGSPLTVRSMNGKYQLMQLDITAAQQNRALLDDVTPGATTLSENDIAVAPYGSALVAKGMYTDSTSQPEKLWYTDLTTGRSQRLSVPDGALNIHAIGWDKLLVPGATQPAPQPTPELPLSAWHNVLIAQDDATETKLVNYDTNNTSNFLVAPNNLSPNAVVDGISPNGKNVLYSDSNGGKTFYWTQAHLPNHGYFYELNSSVAGNALWMPDSRHVLILSTGTGVMEIDTQTGQVHNVLPLPLGNIEIAKLTFYHAGYLYFVGAEGANGILCRVQLGNASATVQQLTNRQTNASYWLSPDSSVIYFANTGPAGQAGIYAVKSDGTHLTLLRPYADARPVGYADDGSLMIMRYLNGNFQLVTLGATEAQDRVVLQDVAPKAASLCDSTVNPGITPLCDNSIALAPLGGALIVEAGYADGSHKVESIDLKTGNRLVLTTLPQGVHIQLIGWDKITPLTG